MNLTDRVLRGVAFGVLLLLLPAVAACSDDEPFEGSQPPSATVVPAPSREPGETTATVSPSSTVAPAESTAAPAEPTVAEPPSGLPAVHIERAFGGLTFDRPTGAYEDGQGNWYVTEQPGRIQRIAAGAGRSEPWLDITDRVNSRGTEMGLLGFALAPDFETSHAFYVDYTDGVQTVISRFIAPDDHASVDPDSEQRLLLIEQPFSNHNGGQIAFGPDGYLYIALGDGGGGNDPNGNGQNLGTLLAAILRIDVAGGGAGYEVPPDNPFVGQAGARGEIWAYGFRNPWRFSFDRETGDLWVGDVGQSTREEVDLVVRGGNYGWNITEGFVCRGGAPRCDSEGLLPPVFDYVSGSGSTCSVTGGFVYRGSAIPGLRGAYVFSDYCSGVIYGLRARDGVLTEQEELTSTGLNVSSFAQDNDGELYVVDLGGGVYKIVP